MPEPEGATPGDADGLLLEGAPSQADISAAEAENVFLAAREHLARRHDPVKAWLTDDYIRRVHRDMFAGVWDWAGSYKKAALNIGVPVERVREEIGKLCQDVAFWDKQEKNSMPLLERAARLHHRLAWIHPFKNGNGRHARLMADIFLFSHRHALPVWPSEDIARKGGPRDQYLAALKAADQGDFKPLTDYTARWIKSE